MTARCTRKNHTHGGTGQAGVTLIELMIAMLIGLILTATVIQIFIGSQQTSRFQESLSRIQENGRYGLSVLVSDLRAADYRGCAGRGLSQGEITDVRDEQKGGGNKDFGPLPLTDLSDAVMGYTGNWTPSLDPEIDDQEPAEHSDVIRLKSMAFSAGSNVSDRQSEGSNLFLDDRTQLEKNDIVLGTNCEKGVVFRINNSTGDKDDPKKKAGQVTVPGIPDFHDKHRPDRVNDGFNRRYFYIDDSGDEPLLMALNTDGSTDELATGVERMAFRYGEDTNDDWQVDEYVMANEVDDWSGVMAVRVSLLIRGPEDNITDEEQKITFPPWLNSEDSTQTFGDKRLRQVFTTTVSLRNRRP